MEPNFRVYVLFEKGKPEQIRYVGYTKWPVEKRLYFHVKSVSYDKTSYKSKWIRSVLKRSNEIETKMLFDGLTESEAKHKEIEVIAEFRSKGYKLTNGTNGGDGLSMPTQETI